MEPDEVETAGDFARCTIKIYRNFNEVETWHPHWHGLLLEGGFDDDGNFVYLPVSNTKGMTELFRRTCIKHFEDNKLINKDFARNLGERYFH